MCNRVGRFWIFTSLSLVLSSVVFQATVSAQGKTQGAEADRTREVGSATKNTRNNKRKKTKARKETTVRIALPFFLLSQPTAVSQPSVIGEVSQPTVLPSVTTNGKGTFGVSRTPSLRIPQPAVIGGALPTQIIISEFRLRGPSGANDEFIEIYNASGAPHTVSAISGTGYGVVASDGTTRCSIPNGTVIPDRGHYLCVNSVAYSLANYGGTGAAAGDASYTTDIPDNAGIALFNNNTGGASYSLANRLDAVGSTSEANTLYKEGTGYPALTPFSIDYSFYRDNCGKQGSITTFGACPSGGLPVDTDNNATNFVFVDTNGTSAGAGQRLGAPGPENLSSPINRNSVVNAVLLDATVAASNPPNRVRDFTSDPANNSTFGTLSIRRRFVNNTAAPVTRLRFRIVDQTTFPAPSGIADLRSRTSVAVVVAGINDAATCAATGAPVTPPCTVTVQGSTLEQPPSSPNGTAFNGSVSAGTVTLGTPLAAGASINLQFLLGIQQTGSFKFFINVEALP